VVKPFSPPVAPPPPRRWQERLADLGDTELAAAIREGGSDGDALRILLPEQQRRWLLRGQNLRAYLAARVLEHELGVRADPSPSHLPAWLCWLAAAFADPRGSRLDFDITEMIPACLALGGESHEHQRFFVAWVSVGLLGETVGWCIQVLQNVPQDTFESSWIDGWPLPRYCLDHLMDAGFRGRRPEIIALESPDSLRRRAEEAVREASRIVDLAVNYRNRFVVRYWFQLVGSGGPVRTLLSQAQSGVFPAPLPDAGQLAGSVPGWHQIQAAYRNNIVQRLTNCLDRLRTAASLYRQLRTQTSSPTTVVRADQVDAALQTSDTFLSHLRQERCPSLVGFEVLLNRLTTLAAGVRS
jgi:hypothetical protein